MKMFECKKLSIGYGNKVVCKNINFEVNKGQYLCVIGENGCGKSTLLKTILGLNKAVSGKVVFNKDFPATVKEVIMSGFVGAMKFRPFFRREEKAKAEKIMEELEIKDLAKKSYKELSGGQQQRVLLARALCATNELLVMDEPVTGLDSKAIRKFYALIKKLNKDNGLTIIMVSHNIDKVIDYATHIIYLSNEKAFVGTKEEFLISDYAKQYKLGDD